MRDVAWAFAHPESPPWAGALSIVCEASPGGDEDGSKHRASELAGEGVLLARVVAGEERDAVTEVAGGTVRKHGARGRRRLAQRAPRAQIGLPADASEADDDAHPVEQAQRVEKIRTAGQDLARQRLVVRRRAADRRRDVGVAQPQAIGGVGLRSEERRVGKGWRSRGGGEEL